jgi:hypothetical protein
MKAIPARFLIANPNLSQQFVNDPLSVLSTINAHAKQNAAIAQRIDKSPLVFAKHSVSFAGFSQAIAL